MIKAIIDKLFGGGSKRYKMTLIYLCVFLGLSLLGKMDAAAFATFSGVYGVWILGETYRKGKE